MNKVPLTKFSKENLADMIVKEQAENIRLKETLNDIRYICLRQIYADVYDYTPTMSDSQSLEKINQIIKKGEGE